MLIFQWYLHFVIFYCILRIFKLKPILAFYNKTYNLYFLVCKVYVSSGRRSTTLNHTDSKKHKNLYERNLAAINRYIKRLQGKYPDYFVSGFVWADTPVCKLRLKPMIDLFTYLKIKIPSETTIWRHLLTKLAQKSIGVLYT